MRREVNKITLAQTVGALLPVKVRFQANAKAFMLISRTAFQPDRDSQKDSDCATRKWTSSATRSVHLRQLIVDETPSKRSLANVGFCHFAKAKAFMLISRAAFRPDRNS